MADNFTSNPGTGGATFASDDIAGIQYPRAKMVWGADGFVNDVSAAAPLPITGALTDAQLRAAAVPTNLIQPDVNTTGTITTTDIGVAAPAGTGALLTGASTAGSFVVSPITAGYTAWVAQITGLTSGNIYFEGSTDSTTGSDGNWINLIGRQIGILNSLMTGVATGNGNWRGNLSAYRFFRLRSVGVLTGTPAILIRMSAGLATVFLNGSIPTGQNVIGGVTGAFFQATQPISAAALPLPTGASTETTLAALNTKTVAVNTGAVVLATGAATIGAVNIAAAQTLATVTTVSAVTAITNALPTGANTIGAVNQGTANAAAWLANPLTSQITAEASSAKVATGNSAATIVNASSTGVMLFLNASVVSGTTPSLTVSVQVQDPVSAAWVNLPGASFPAVIAVTATPLLLIIDLGVVAVANAVVNMPMPRSWRLAWVISGTTPSFTFSVGAQYLV